MKTRITLIFVATVLALVLMPGCTPAPEPAAPAAEPPAAAPQEPDPELLAQIAQLESDLAAAQAAAEEGEANRELIESLEAQLEELQAAAAPAEGAGLSLEGKTIGIAVIGTDHYWDRVAFNSAVEAVIELGGTPIAVDGERDDQKHITNHENLIAQNPDAIISILGAVDVMDPVFQRISEAGIPLFTVDHPSPYSINNSTSDNYFLGSATARMLAEELGGQGRIAVFNGFYAVRICQQRYDLFKYVLQDYPGIEILEPELQDVIPNTIEDARQKTADLLVRYPEGELDAIHVACWDIPEIGIVQAVQQAGRDEITVSGIDAGPEVLEIIAQPDSPIPFAFMQQPAVIARTAAYNVARYFAGEELPKTSYIEVMYVTAANVPEALRTLGIEE